MSSTVEAPPAEVRAPSRRSLWPWLVAVTAFVALVAAGSFRAAPSVLIEPLQDDFGWSRGTISAAVMVNLILYGLTSPFAAALMDRFGMRVVVAGALTLIAIGSALTLFMAESWQLILCWGVLVGLGAGSMALAFVATVTNRWFVKRKGLVTGILTAGGAAGQLVFLPILAWLAEHHSWKSVSLTVSLAALAVIPIVLVCLRNRPQDVGTVPYGAGEPGYPMPPPAPAPGEIRGAGARTLRVLSEARRTKVFWLLAGTFAICGASTNGLIGTHFIPAAHDHGMANTTAAGLLALVGIFDIAGTIGSGWLTDRVESRTLLTVYYARPRRVVDVPADAADRPRPAADAVLHRVLRTRLGRHGATDGRPVPHPLRRRRRHRVRMGPRGPSGRRWSGRPQCRSAPRQPRLVRRRLVCRRRAVHPGRRHVVLHPTPPEPGDQLRKRRGTGRRAHDRLTVPYSRR